MPAQWEREKHEETVSLFMTQGYISFPPVISVNEVLGQFREVARDKDVIMYVYVVDIENHLLGVIDMKELLQAESDNLLHEIISLRESRAWA